jgi:secreted trypsin-like serine protease
VSQRARRADEGCKADTNYCGEDTGEGRWVKTISHRWAQIQMR